jgi:hypothetical protein
MTADFQRRRAPINCAPSLFPQGGKVTQEHIQNELVPLSSAAATAYLTLADGPRAARAQLSAGLRDVAAVALAACIPIYGACSDDEPLRRLTDADLDGGRFVQGATRLQFRNGKRAFTRLAVTTADFADALIRLARAGVNFSLARCEFAPRRVPTVVPQFA